MTLGCESHQFPQAWTPFGLIPHCDENSVSRSLQYDSGWLQWRVCQSIGWCFQLHLNTTLGG